MAEVKLVVKPDHEWAPREVFPVELVWRPLYVEGSTKRPEWNSPDWNKRVTVWHVVGGAGIVPVCKNIGYGRRAMTINQMQEMSRWSGEHRKHRICGSCQRVMNARARAHGVC